MKVNTFFMYEESRRDSRTTRAHLFCVSSVTLSSQKTMCLSHTHRKTSFTQQECEITMFQDWGVEGGGWLVVGLPVGRNLSTLGRHQAKQWPLNSWTLSGHQCFTSAGVNSGNWFKTQCVADVRHTTHSNYRKENVKDWAYVTDGRVVTRAPIYNLQWQITIFTKS